MKAHSLKIGASLMALCMSSGALAQSTEPTPSGTGETAPSQPDRDRSSVPDAEIVVTARKREESLVDVPLAITAFTQEDIQKAGIESVADLALQTPGFSFRQGFGRTGSAEAGASVRPSIRGMSNILGAPNAGFFVDGIFVSGNITSYQLDNLERVEVIRGPQSALFGRQTFSGAINFVTRKPGNEFAGRLNLTAGQYDNYEGSGYVVVPLARDAVSAEFNARYYTFGGDYVNQDSGKRDINAQRSWNVGAKIRVFQGDNFEAIAQAAYGEDQDKGYATFKLGSQNLNCFLPQIIGSFAGIPRSSNRSRGYFCGEIKAPETFAFNLNEIEELGYHPADREYFRSNLTLEYTTDGGWIFTSVSAYNHQDNQNGFDNTYVPSTTPNITIEGLKNDDFSQEFRVLTPRQSRIRVLAGAYYFKSRIGQGFSVTTLKTDPNFGRIRRYNSDDAVVNKAVFGMVEADVFDALTVTAEARYQSDKIIGSTETTSAFDAITPPTGQREVTFKSFLPRFTARYELGSDWNLYGSVAKGNKPGGFNDVPADASAAARADFIARGADKFDEEDVWSYELGTKGRFGRIYFNLAGYYLDWTKQQLTQSQPYQRTNNTFTTFPFIVNAGKSRIKGFEAELSGPITDWFDFRVGYSFNDARFVDFYDINTEELLDTDGRPSFLDIAFTQPNPADVDGPDGQVKGNKLPQTPRHDLNLSGNVRFPLNEAMSFFFRSDYSYESKRFVQVHNLAFTGATHNLNFRTGVEWGNLTLTAFVNNALNDETPLVGTRLFDFNRSLLVPDPVRSFASLRNTTLTFYRDFIVSSPRRRQFGLMANYKF
jgi:outer membrane receptor protein involved in Fe transport